MVIQPASKVSPLQPDQILLWDPKLRNLKCDPVREFGEELRALAKRLTVTCRVNNGVGLAAPQIGVFQRVVVVNFPLTDPPRVLVNPVIDEINSKGESIAFEACLSIPGARVEARVRRCSDIAYEYQDLDGVRHEEAAGGFLSRVIAHEVDHLNGIFYIDRITGTTRDMVMRKFHKASSRLTAV